MTEPTSAPKSNPVVSPTALLICATLLIVTLMLIVGGLVLEDKDPALFINVLVTLLAGTGATAAGVNLWYAKATAHNSKQAATALNGGFDARVKNILAEALTEHELK